MMTEKTITLNAQTYSELAKNWGAEKAFNKMMESAGSRKPLEITGYGLQVKASHPDLSIRIEFRYNSGATTTLKFPICALGSNREDAARNLLSHVFDPSQVLMQARRKNWDRTIRGYALLVGAVNGMSGKILSFNGSAEPEAKNEQRKNPPSARSLKPPAP